MSHRQTPLGSSRQPKTTRRGSSASLRKLFLNHRTDFGPLSARPSRETPLHNVVGRGPVVVAQAGDELIRIGIAAQIGGAADNHIAGDQVGIIKAHLHGPYPAHRIADQNRPVNAEGGQGRGASSAAMS